MAIVIKGDISRSREGARIEIFTYFEEFFQRRVAPVRERGLKFCILSVHIQLSRRSREGARIEMLLCTYVRSIPIVAPVRERGLKSPVPWSFGILLKSLP